MNALEQHFELLNEAAIREQHFDILANKWTMKLEWIDGDYSKWHDLIFHDVSCFYFVNDNTGDRKEIWEPEEGDYLEISGSYDWRSKPDDEEEDLTLTLHSNSGEWLNDYNSNGNIVIEIWTSLLVIEAKSVQIDNTTYDLY